MSTPISHTHGLEPGWAFLLPCADAMPPCLQLAGSPRPGLRCQDQEARASERPSPPPRHDITLAQPWGHLPSGYGSTPPSRGVCANPNQNACCASSPCP